MTLAVKLPGFGDYDEKTHCALLMDVFESGLAVPSFCKQARISNKTFYRWLEKFEPFAQTYELAKNCLKAHYHERLVDAMDTKEANLPAILAAARMVAGMSDKRLLKLEGINKDGTFQEHYACLLQNIASGEMETLEAKAFADILAVGVKIDEATTQKERIDVLEEHAGLV